MTDVRPVYEDYPNWLEEEQGFRLGTPEKNRYISATDRIRTIFEQSQLWTDLKQRLKEYNDEYLVKTGYPLLVEFEPKLKAKPYDSFLLKTYRKNVSENKNWPSAPDGGWITPENWYSRINDIIRTLLVVKYLDGVKFTVEKVESLCKEHGSDCQVDLEAREEGYYAAHLYTKREFEIAAITWDTMKVDVSIELQITTQLQEVIRKLLHKYYETRRKQPRAEDVKWQWNYKSDEFAANYLGHILHYVEGMIMDIIEKQNRKEKRL